MESRRIGNVIPYNILIKPSDNMGFIVRIGCGVRNIEGPGALLVAESIDALLDLLHTYLEDPKGCLKEYEEMCKETPIAEVARPSRPETDAGAGNLRGRAIGDDSEERATVEEAAPEAERRE